MGPNWSRNHCVVQTWTHGIDIDSWYRHGLMLYTWTHGIDMDSWYRHGLMVQTWAHGIDNTHDIHAEYCAQFYNRVV